MHESTTNSSDIFDDSLSDPAKYMREASARAKLIGNQEQAEKKEKQTKTQRLLMTIGGVAIVAAAATTAGLVLGAIGNSLDQSSDAYQDRMQNEIAKNDQAAREIAAQNGELSVYDQLPELEPYVDPTDTKIPSPTQIENNETAPTLPSPVQIGSENEPSLPSPNTR